MERRRPRRRRCERTTFPATRTSPRAADADSPAGGDSPAGAGRATSDGEVERELKEVKQAIQDSYTKLEKELEGLDEDSAEAVALAEAHREQAKPLVQRRQALTEELDGLTFGQKDGYFVWLFERLED